MTPSPFKHLQLFYLENFHMNLVRDFENILKDSITKIDCSCFMVLAMITNIQQYHLQILFLDL